MAPLLGGASHRSPFSKDYVEPPHGMIFWKPGTAPDDRPSDRRPLVRPGNYSAASSTLTIVSEKPVLPVSPRTVFI
jgi:hypothetical protein